MDAKESLIGDASLVVKSYPHRETGRRVAFIIYKADLESRIGFKLVKGESYLIDWRVPGVGQFQAQRLMTRNREIALYSSNDLPATFAPHREYQIDLCIQRLDGRDGEIFGLPSGYKMAEYKKGEPIRFLRTAYVQRGKCTRISFRVPKSLIESQAGIEFDDNKVYVISGTLGRTCEYKLKHWRGAYSNELTIAVPKEYTPKFVPGVKYELAVNTIEIFDAFSEGKAEEWSWPLVGTWTNTEGSYVVNKNSSVCAVISQKEREPLVGIGSFLRNEEIPSGIVVQRGKYFQLKTYGGPEAMAKFIKQTEPYIRTQNKKDQIARVKEEIGRVRLHDNVHLKRARYILGQAA